MDTLFRHWLILRMIPRRVRIATTTIKERLASEYSIETTLRTIQRDLITLEASQFPIECDDNRPAGWRWREDAPTFDLPNMDPVTALTFRLAELHLSRLMPHGALSVLKPYFRTAEERLRLTAESGLSTWSDKIRIVSQNLVHLPPAVPDEISEAVYTALLKGRRFKASYKAIGGKPKEYEVNPLGMALVEGLTYLIATLNQHTDPVLLLLHRIRKVTPLDASSTTPDGFDLDAYIEKELVFPVGEQIDLKVRFSKKSDVERLEEAPVAKNQAVRQAGDGTFEFKATLNDTTQLRWWLRGYGDRVEVLEPEYLRAEFTGLARTLADTYLH